MNKLFVLFKYEFLSILTGKWLWAFLVLYNLFFALITYYSSETQQFYISSANLLVYFNFTALILFANLYWQNNSDFISLILTQPVSRRIVFVARISAFYAVLFLTTAISLIFHLSKLLDVHEIATLATYQVVAQAISIGIGFLLAISINDRLKSLAFGMGLIVLFVFILDALNLWIIINYSRYPLEKLLLFLNSLNPVSLVKFESLRNINTPLWSGYSGILLRRAFDDQFMRFINIFVLFTWWFAPTFWSMRTFNKKDF